MKLLFITTVPAPYKTELFNNLAESCDLTVLFERAKDIERDDEWYGECNRFKAIFLSNRIHVNNFHLPCFHVKKFLKRNYDHIIIDGYNSPTLMFAIEYMRICRIPYIQYVDGGIISDDSKIKYFIKYHFISSASIWLSSGDPTTEYLTHYGARKENCLNYPFTSLTEADMIQNRITKEEKDKIKSALNMKESKIVLSVGSFIYRKGFDILLKALEYVDEEVGVYIIGGECTQEYLDLINEHGLKHIYFLPFMSKNELQKYYIASDLFVFPTRHDVWGLVINEAMAYGLPVISTDKCVAAVTLLDKECITPVGDEKELAKRMNLILENNELANSISINNFKKIQDYTIEKMASRILDILVNKREERSRVSQTP